MYALGAVTYQMLAGEPPFTGPSVQAIVAKVLTEKPAARHRSDDEVGRTAMTKAMWRILPLMLFCYMIAYIDRVNVSFASLQMNADLAFSATIYGLGGGLFFLGYALFEVPSSVMLRRYSAPQWIARIMVTWGLLAMGMMFVRTPVQFYVMRFLLGVAEAGFFPSLVYYFATWFPSASRGRAVSRIYIAAPMSSLILGGISGALLGLDGLAGLRGWQWLFLVQGLPAVLMGVLVLFALPSVPTTATWLRDTRKLGSSGNSRGTQPASAPQRGTASSTRFGIRACCCSLRWGSSSMLPSMACCCRHRRC